MGKDLIAPSIKADGQGPVEQYLHHRLPDLLRLHATSLVGEDALGTGVRTGALHCLQLCSQAGAVGKHLLGCLVPSIWLTAAPGKGELHGAVQLGAARALLLVVPQWRQELGEARVLWVVWELSSSSLSNFSV